MKGGISMATVQPITQLQGALFVGQSCSCSCDPCTCKDTCTCEGADAYLGPRWRLVGDHVIAGHINHVDVSQRTLLHFAQTVNEADNTWHEAILIDDKASPQQVQALLAFFEKQRGSDLAHPNRPSAQKCVVYLVPMHYRQVDGHPTLSVTLSQDRLHPVNGSMSLADAYLSTWTYNGHVAVQQHLDYTL